MILCGVAPAVTRRRDVARCFLENALDLHAACSETWSVCEDRDGARGDGGGLDLGALPRLEYLDAVVKESLRLRPILPDVVRRVALTERRRPARRPEATA